MKRFGFINSPSDLKGIQLNIYKGDGLYIGITKEGHLYVYNENGVTRIYKDDAMGILNMSSEQLDKIIRRRGNIEESDLSEGDVLVDAQTRKKSIDVKAKADIDIEIDEDNEKIKPEKSKASKILKKLFPVRNHVELDIHEERENRHDYNKDESLGYNEADLVRVEKSILNSKSKRKNTSSPDIPDGKELRNLQRQIDEIRNTMVTKDDLLKIIKIINKENKK